MNLQDLKNKQPEELLKEATKLEIENPSSLRKQDLMFAILKQIATDGEIITGSGVIEIMQDGFGFLRSAESNYLPGPDDIYVSPSQIKKFSLRTGDIVEGEIRAPKQGERYFAVTKINKINDWKNLSDLVPSKFKKSENLKRTGLSGLFSASLELTKEGFIDIMQKKAFDKLLIIKRK